MTRRRFRLLMASAWTLAFVSMVLLVASLTGRGEGLLNTGIMRGPGWSFGVLLVVGVSVLAILLALPSRPTRG